MYFMNIKLDVHGNHKFENKLKNIENWDIPESVKKEVKDFIAKAAIGQVQQGKRLSDRTLSKYLSLLKVCLEIINKQTGKLVKKDVEVFEKQISSLELKSVRDYRRILKIFLRWKHGTEKMQKLAGWLDTRDKVKTPDYLSEAEILRLFNYCKNPSERFLISVLYDTGCRAEEFLNIRYEDIQLPKPNGNYVKILLKEEYSKTAGRNISLYWKHSLNSVRDYLKERETDGISSNEPVFKNSYDAMRMFLSRLGKKVLNKKIYPHLFRHSSATYYASKLNRQELCYRYGWKFSSDMPDVYISRAGMESKELDEKFKATELEALEKRVAEDKILHAQQIEDLKRNIKNKLSDINRFGAATNKLFEDEKVQKALVRAMIQTGIGKKLLELAGK